MTEPSQAREPWVYTNSASQVENYLTCKRKWFLDTVLRLKGPQKPSAALGSRAHEISEAWLRFGTEPDGAECLRWTATSKAGKTYEVVKYPGRIFMNGIHLLPAPGTVIVEGRFKTTLPSGRVFSGARDQLGIINGRAWVGDNKNVSSPMWALTADELHTNVQAQIYFYDVLTRYGVGEVDGQWTYFLTDESPNPPKKEWSTREQRAKWAAWVKAGRLLAWPVKVTAKRLPVLEQIAVIDQHAACMDELRLSVTSAQDVEPDTNGCDAYGGCPHKGTERCSLTVSQVYSRLANRGDIRTMALADLANQLAPAQAALAAANPGAIVPSPVGAPPEWKLGDPLNQSQAMKAGIGKALWVVALAADVPPDEEAVLLWPDAKLPYQAALQAKVAREAPELVARVQAAGGPPPVVMAPAVGVPESGRINPPEAPSVAAASPEQALELHQAAQAAAGLTQINLQAAEAFDDRKAIKAELERLGACDAAGKPITQSSSHGTPTLVALLKEARAKAAGGAPSVPPVSAPPVSAPAVTAPPVSAPYEAPISPIGKAFRLCIDTVPSVSHDTFAPIAAAALARFREKHDAAHYAGYDYGKGPGIFATYVEAHIVEGPGVPTGILYVNSGNPEVRDAMGTLERLASEVYRGH